MSGDDGAQSSEREETGRSHEILPFVIAIMIAVLAVAAVAAVTGKQVSNVFSNISNGLFAGSG